MKRLRWLLLLGLASVAFGEANKLPQNLEEKSYYDFSGGLDSYHSSLSLPDTFVANSLNVLFDLQAPIVKRQGYTVAFSTKSYQYQQTWGYTDKSNTSWIIARASDSIVANNLSGTATVLVATVSVNNLVGETNANGFAFFVDQTQGVYYWNGSSTTYVANSPFGSLITNFHQRVWVAGAAPPNGNQLYGSKQNDATTWAIGINPADPVQLTVGLQDNFDNITALYPFIDTLYVYKHYATNALYGFDQTNFQISLITQECGCVDQNSIQTFNHGLYFMSLRGVEFFDGYTCTRVSDPVKNKVDPSIASQSGFNQQSWVQSSQLDWQSGTIGNNGPTPSLSTTISAPGLIISSGIWTDSTTASFNSGTIGGGVSSATANQLSLTTFANEPMTNITNWTTTSGSWAVNPLKPTSTQSNLKFNSSPINTDFDLLEFQFNLNGQCPPTGNLFGDVGLLNGSNNGYEIEFQYGSGKIIRVCKTTSWSDSGALQCSGSPVSVTGPCDSNWHTVDMLRDPLAGGTSFYIDGTFQGALIDTSYSGLSTIKLDAEVATGITTPSFMNFFVQPTQANFISQVHDSGFSTPVWGLFSATISGGGSVTFGERTSNVSGSGYSGDTVVSTSSVTNIANQRYVIYSATMTSGQTSYNTNPPVISNFSQAFEPSTGTFRSQIKSLGQATSFGNFSVTDALNNGTIVFSICSSTMSTMSPPSQCATQTANGPITISTGTGGSGTFVQWYATYTVTSATQTPTLNSATVQWFSGSKAPPLASTVWDNRYWLSLSTNPGDAFNDSVLVLNKKGSWGIFDIHAGGFVQYKNNLYHSDSLSSGNIYLDNQGYADNGAAINAFIQTKDYTQGSLSEDDYFDSIYPSMDNLGNYNMNITYYMDRLYSAPYTLSSVNQTEFSTNGSIKIPFLQNATNQNFGKTITYLFQEADPNSPWQFYGFSHYFHTRPVQ